MTPKEISISTGARIDRAQRFETALTAAMQEFGIDTRMRKAMFLANVGHESGGLRYTTEIWDGKGAQAGYEGRKDLGNTQLGDGFRFRGRGLLMTTGRYNYEKTGAALGLDLLTFPELLAEPVAAARAAGWFWARNGLSALADAGDFKGVVKRINGGYNGLTEREELYRAALEVIEE